jgi:hypothetical protein
MRFAQAPGGITVSVYGDASEGDLVAYSKNAASGGGAAPAAYTNGALGSNATNTWLPDGTPVRAHASIHSPRVFI